MARQAEPVVQLLLAGLRRRYHLQPQVARAVLFMPPCLFCVENITDETIILCGHSRTEPCVPLHAIAETCEPLLAPAVKFGSCTPAHFSIANH
jgi:hypothetical protein